MTNFSDNYKFLFQPFFTGFLPPFYRNCLCFVCFCVKEFVHECDYFYATFHVFQHPRDTCHESNTCSLTPGCFYRCNLTLHMKAGHCVCRLTFQRGQWRCIRTLKQREEALSRWAAHTPSHKWEVFHVPGLFVSPLWLLEKGKWMLEGSVDCKWGLWMM